MSTYKVGDKIRITNSALSVLKNRVGMEAYIVELPNSELFSVAVNLPGLGLVALRDFEFELVKPKTVVSETRYNLYYNHKGNSYNQDNLSLVEALASARVVLILGGEVTSIINKEED